MRKFFVEENQISDSNIIITGEDVNHIKNVLRLEPGTRIKVCDRENSINYISEITTLSSNEVICKIVEKVEGVAESNVKLHIYQGLPKADKMELIIQKCTELGAYEFIPVEMKRSIVKVSGKDADKKVDRWNKISEVAAKQSGRDVIPKVRNIINIKTLINEINGYDLVLLAYEEENVNHIKNELTKVKEDGKDYNIAVIIGPEGGLDPEEVNLLKEAGAKVVTLGTRILRTETAPIMITSCIMYELENGGK